MNEKVLVTKGTRLAFAMLALLMALAALQALSVHPAEAQWCDPAPIPSCTPGPPQTPRC